MITTPFVSDVKTESLNIMHTNPILSRIRYCIYVQSQLPLILPYSYFKFKIVLNGYEPST
jgi:hypothetical protein